MMSRLLVVAVLVAAVAVSPRSTSGQAGQLSVRVSPATSRAPANLFVQVLMERHADNRWFRMTLESPEYFSSSEAELAGAGSPRIRVIMFRDVPAGAYELQVEVLGERGLVRMAARTSALVIGM